MNSFDEKEGSSNGDPQSDEEASENDSTLELLDGYSSDCLLEESFELEDRFRVVE